MDVSNSIGGSGDLPAWVQALGSILAIVAAGAAAVGVPVWERHLDRLRANKARLKVATREFAHSPGLAVTIHYEPEDEHQGLVAVISILPTPDDLYLLPATRNQPVDPLGLLTVTVDAVVAAKETQLPLLRMRNDPRAGYGAAFVVCELAMEERPSFAKVQIVVKTKIDEVALAKQQFTVSPIS